MSEGWRCTPHTSYGILGWIETIIKSLAVLTAIVAMETFRLLIDPSALNDPRIAQTVLFGGLVAWHAFQIVHRFLVGELFAVVFAFIQIVGVILMFLVSLFTLDPGGYVFCFAFLMILGQIVAIMFLCLREELEIRLLQKPALIGINILLLIVYLAILTIQIVLWVGGFRGDNGN
jgi:hypothetical protein